MHNYLQKMSINVWKYNILYDKIMYIYKIFLGLLVIIKNRG